jgi:hypothetical protein
VVALHLFMDSMLSSLCLYRVVSRLGVWRLAQAWRACGRRARSYLGLKFGLIELLMAGPLWALFHVGDGLLRAGVGRALLRYHFRGETRWGFFLHSTC